MVTLQVDIIEEEVIAVVKEYCTTLMIDVAVDIEFCPGNHIKSQVLLTAISIIGNALGITIPNECYIFSDKDYKQLSIKETAQKILKVAKNEK